MPGLRLGRSVVVKETDAAGITISRVLVAGRAGQGEDDRLSGQRKDLAKRSLALFFTSPLFFHSANERCLANCVIAARF